jgi:hypothetical protein
MIVAVIRQRRHPMADRPSRGDPSQLESHVNTGRLAGRYQPDRQLDFVSGLRFTSGDDAHDPKATSGELLE